jgi:hypothetical protein
MWAVLLDGSDGQYGDGFVDAVAYGQLRELAGRQVGPEWGGEGHGSILTAVLGRTGTLLMMQFRMAKVDAQNQIDHE